MGKVGSPRGILKRDPSSDETWAEKELNLDTIFEKLACDVSVRSPFPSTFCDY